MKKALDKHPRAEELSFIDEDLRWATPKIVADYRAKRLKCNVIADLGCGVGFQTFSFAATCQKVLAVEKDYRKIENARKNAEALGFHNIEFIEGDSLDPGIIRKLQNAECIFCDPERLPEEKERSIMTIKPSIPDLLNAYSTITDKIALEFPPQIKTIPYDCEREFISVDGELNRLTLYFGALKQSERSAVVLPAAAILRGKPAEAGVQVNEAEKYLYEVDPAVVKAKLVSEFIVRTKTNLLQAGKITLVTSPRQITSNFVKSSFQVLKTIPFHSREIHVALEKIKAGKVILRIPVDPKEYWTMRKYYERAGNGRTVHLFKIGETAVIAEKT